MIQMAPLPRHPQRCTTLRPLCRKMRRWMWVWRIATLTTRRRPCRPDQWRRHLRRRAPPLVPFPSSSSASDLKAEEPTPDVKPTPTPTPAAPPAPLVEPARARVRASATTRCSAFRDCHVALQELRAALNTSSSPSAHSPSTSSSSVSQQQQRERKQGKQGQGHEVLQSAVERLHDYTEDARVELEIRVADGRVLARGWETIVGMPSASASSQEAPSQNGPGEAEVRRRVAACVERVRVAQEGLERKLGDVEHDIAVVKSVVYAPPSVDADADDPPALPKLLVAEPAPAAKPAGECRDTG
ncbi:hypothetical protein B0H16DRAFT_1587985 [Mycena metata]|uniref:Uncharacterized protein n=1 Tax=Mycena metata TaxID=1033252 RepID=A0AAD7HWJ4_9AGAR|nr:hypothetical protein B0H16DRAFT_1587985 [Mycena metata]